MNQFKQWHKPRIVMMSNDIVQSGGGNPLPFESVVGCDGPITFGADPVPGAGPCDSTRLTGSITTYIAGSVVDGGLAGYSSCFTDCS